MSDHPTSFPSSNKESHIENDREIEGKKDRESQTDHHLSLLLLLLLLLLLTNGEN